MNYFMQHWIGNSIGNMGFGFHIYMCIEKFHIKHTANLQDFICIRIFYINSHIHNYYMYLHHGFYQHYLLCLVSAL